MISLSRDFCFAKTRNSLASGKADPFFLYWKFNQQPEVQWRSISQLEATRAYLKHGKKRIAVTQFKEPMQDYRN